MSLSETPETMLKPQWTPLKNLDTEQPHWSIVRKQRWHRATTGKLNEIPWTMHSHWLRSSETPKMTESHSMSGTGIPKMTKKKSEQQLENWVHSKLSQTAALGHFRPQKLPFEQQCKTLDDKKPSQCMEIWPRNYLEKVNWAALWHLKPCWAIPVSSSEIHVTKNHSNEMQ